MPPKPPTAGKTTTPKSGTTGSKTLGTPKSGGAIKGGARKGGGSPLVGSKERAPPPGSVAEKKLKEKEKKAAKEEAARLAAQEAEKAKQDTYIKAKEEKRAQLANSHAEGIRQRREQELLVQLQRNQLRGEENARKRLAREEKEKSASWPYNMRLHAAALEGNQVVADVFLKEDEEGAFNVARIDPNVQWREDGQSPIFLATVKGQLHIMKRLITAKADVNITNNDGRSPLALGAEFGQTPAMTILIEAGAKVNACDSRGRTALHVAVSFNRLDTARSLLLWHADPNIQSNTQLWTPLHIASSHPSPNMLMVWMLLAGPDLPIQALAETMGGREGSFDADPLLEDVPKDDEEEEEEEGEEEEEDEWGCDSDVVKEEDSYQMIEGDVARLRPGSTWKQYASKNVSLSCLAVPLVPSSSPPTRVSFSCASSLCDVCVVVLLLS